MTEPASSPVPIQVLNDLLAQSDDQAMVIRQYATGWPLVYASPGLTALIGTTTPLEQLIGQPFSSYVHPECLANLDGALHALDQDNHGQVITCEYQLGCDGETMRCIQDRSRIIKGFGQDSQGKYIASTLMDISRLKQVERDLEEKRKRLELVLEGTRLGMWDWNPQTNHVHFNERWATMLGYEYDEIKHELATWEGKVHPDDLASCYADITAHMEGKIDFYENVHRMRHKDGSWRYILDRGKIVDRDSAGNPTRFTGTHTDITQQKEAELKAKQAAQAKAQFTANISHEIRTPLHGMLGLLSIIDQTVLTPRDQRLFKTVQNSATLLKGIINDILDFSKLDSNKVELSNKPTSLTKLIQQSVSLYQVMAHEKHLTVNYHTQQLQHDTFMVDPLRLSQCLNNLLSNAIKFTAQGSVTINASNDANHVYVSVSDTGIGIEDVDKVFDLFHQEGELNTTQGTGLGLSITRQLATLMGGTVSVQSQLGVGTTFTLALPLEATQLADDELQTKLNHDIAKKRILIAEDNSINQLVITEMLQELGHEFVLANDGLEAIDALQKQTFDYIFLDLHMPRLDGHGVLNFMAEQTLNLPVVMMSADVFDKKTSKLVTAVLNKPFEKNALVSLLAQLQARQS